MTDIRDWEFELNGYRFGRHQPVRVSKLDRGGSDTREQDQAGLGDFTMFGTDRKTPGTWSFEMFTHLDDAESALAALEDIESLWDAEDVRATPGAVLPLTYRVGGRVRRVYGRPRRFTAIPTTILEQGRIDIVADFKLAEPWSYDDDEESAELGLNSAILSGEPVTFPLSFPKIWGGSPSSPRTRTILVGGRRSTWITLTFHAGADTLRNPFVVIDGEPLNFSGNVSVGEADVAVSAIPWEQGIYHVDDGSGAELTLDTFSRLSTLRLGPGLHQITFGGIDGTGTATCTVTWRNAYKSI